MCSVEAMKLHFLNIFKIKFIEVILVNSEFQGYSYVILHLYAALCAHHP